MLRGLRLTNSRKEPRRRPNRLSRDLAHVANLYRDEGVEDTDASL